MATGTAKRTVDHDILIQKFTTKFGINGVALNWFKSCLERRLQHVSVQGSVSEKVLVRDHYCLYYIQQNFSMY